MPHFLTHTWQTLAGKRSTKDARDAQTPSESTRAEQLEHISVYARAGYFNMGYTVDVFQLPGDSPLH